MCSHALLNVYSIVHYKNIPKNSTARGLSHFLRRIAPRHSGGGQTRFLGTSSVIWRSYEQLYAQFEVMLRENMHQLELSSGLYSSALFT